MAGFIEHGDVEAGNHRRCVGKQAPLDAAGQGQLPVQPGVFQRQRHVCQKSVQKFLVFAGEAAFPFVQQLQDTDNLPGAVANGDAEQVMGSVVEPLVEAGIKMGTGVRIVDVQRLAGLGDIVSHSLSKGKPDFLLLQAVGYDGPDFPPILIEQKNAASVGVGLFAGQVQNQVQQIAQIQGGIQHLAGFHQELELGDDLSAFAQAARAVQSGARHGCVNLRPARNFRRWLLTAIDGQQSSRPVAHL